jgi:prevent-host-death family protein
MTIVELQSDASIGLFEAKTHLSDLVSRAEAGEVITITRHGKPVARLVPPLRRSSAADLRRRIEGVQAHLADEELLTSLEEISDMKREGRL